MVTRGDIIKIINKKDISQETINAIHDIILSNNEENEIEHYVLKCDNLTNEKIFVSYDSPTFIETFCY